jgi:hypothetical protein
LENTLKSSTQVHQLGAAGAHLQLKNNERNAGLFFFTILGSKGSPKHPTQATNTSSASPAMTPSFPHEPSQELWLLDAYTSVKDDSPLNLSNNNIQKFQSSMKEFVRRLLI